MFFDNFLSASIDLFPSVSAINIESPPIKLSFLIFVENNDIQEIKNHKREYLGAFFRKLSKINFCDRNFI